MLRFEFHLDDADQPSGLGLGHMVIANGEVAIRSEDGGARMKSMLVPTAVDLLGALQQLLEQGQGRTSFVGADSSFEVVIVLDWTGSVTLSHGATSVGPVPLDDLWAAAARDVVGFLDGVIDRLTSGDVARGDAMAAARAFRGALAAQSH